MQNLLFVNFLKIFDRNLSACITLDKPYEDISSNFIE